MLPNVQDKDGVDIGCGHGYNTRLLKMLCRSLIGIDYSDKLIAYAKEIEQNSPLGIEFRHGDTTNLDLPDERYDFATAFMSFIDIHDYEKAFREVFRILKKGEFFQFSILHPCFMERIARESFSSWIVNKEGNKVGKIVAEYTGGNEPCLIEWMVDGVGQSLKKKRLKTLRFKRTQSDWLNAIQRIGFVFEEMVEPMARAEDVLKQPLLQGTDIVLRFQLIRCIKSACTVSFFQSKVLNASSCPHSPDKNV